jgi:uncharacterized repeat protein (TIGR03806 family)
MTTIERTKRPLSGHSRSGGKRGRKAVGQDMNTHGPRFRYAGLVATLACGSAGEAQVLYDPWVEPPGPRQPAFLAFSSAYDGRGPAPIGAPNFPKRLSDTGAFLDAAELVTVSGVVPYDIQVPLWSDGAHKQRWVSVPEGSTLGYSETEHYEVPPGTVFIKHFEIALDERFPQQRRRLETRFWVAASADAQYGVSYKWNEDQTDAELLIDKQTDTLSITGPDGTLREQPYFYPGPADCQTCHTKQAGYVLGARTAQLNRTVAYRADRPSTNQLTAWSSWGLLNARLDATALVGAPQLPAFADATHSLEERIRSYWDGNCSMCHSGAEGNVPGWDARYTTPLAEQGLDQAPRKLGASASHLITPGSPDDSFIFLRGDTTDVDLRMPPLGRNRIDDAYVASLSEWITSLAETP